MKKNNRLEKMRKSIPLKTRLKVLNEMSFIDLITKLGYREDKMWTFEEDEILQKICDHAIKLAEEQLDKIKEWEIDGKPQ